MSGTNSYFTTPTPGDYNRNPGFNGYVADTKFSHDHGFYATNFLLAITSATPGATIKYTLNGSAPSATNGFTYAGPIPITNTTTLRAVALLAGLASSDIDTMTYIFVNDVVLQRDETAPGPGWPAQRKATGSGQVYDYGMDPDIVNNAIWGATIREDLKSLPSFSLVMDLRDLFDPTTGIYANPSGDEIAWERPGSVELIQPDGTKGFQINCGVRVRGGFSRSPDNPKHAFRFFFRQKYGANKLDYPLFGSDAAQSFDKVDLRTFQNYSWAFQNDPKMICLRDQFSRDAQLALNQPAEHGDFFHLYINGQYWGLYNTDERAEASYGESYFGGFQEDYDTVKVDPDLGYLIEPTDGNLDAWFRLWQVATNGFANDADYFRIQGLNLDGTPNPAYENLLDIDNLIDYMLVIVFGGNLDAPISNFLANDSPNNWFGMRHRGGLSGGFKFFAHDSEHTLRVDGGELTRDRTGLVNNQSGGAIDPDWTAGNPLTQINNSVYSPADAFSKSSPQYLWFRLAANPEFRLRVADHVQKSFFDGGVFTTEGGRAMFLARSNQIYRAIVCESARWGDAKTTTPYNRNTWITEMNNIGGQYFSQRPAIVLGQLRARGLFPNVLAPRFSQNGGFITFGSSLFLTNLNANSTLYYTLDGQDPRARGGNPAATAQSYTAGTPLPILFQTTIRARVRSNTVWSAITEATFYPIQDLARLLVSEVMYNPPPFAGSPGDDFEFIELKNVGTNTLELGGFQFTDGITFTFTNGTRLAGGQFVVLVRNPAKFSAKYPGVAIHGTYTGRLDNGGEKLTLTHPLGGVVFSFDYKDSGRWPITPDGYGFSLVPRHPNANPDPDGPSNWRASAMSGGSPGLDDPEPAVARIVINEALTHSLSPEVDMIELFNPTDAPVDLGGWFLTDDAARPMKFRIPDGTMILARSYRLFTESDFNPVPATTNNFALSGEGDELYLLSGDASTNLTGYSHGFSFGAAATNVSFGLLVTSDGVEHFPAQLANTLGATNAGPLVGPLVIAQIMYHPPDLPGGLDDSTNEFVEIRNISGADVALFDPDRPMNTWHVRGGINFDFPTNIMLPSGQSLVVVTFNSADATLLAKFRARYNSFAGVPAFGPAAGKLSNDRDSVELNRPGVPTTNGVPRILVDEVSYRDFSPWPAAADGTGAALQRLHLAEYGNEPTNWAGQIPLSLFTQPLSQTTRATSNVVFSVGAIGTGPLTYQWRLNGTNLANGGGFSGVATSALVITNAFAQHRGVYTVVVTDSRDSAISVPATLEVQIAPIIIAQPQSLTAPAGSTVSFTIVLSNVTSLPVGYRWRSNFTTRPFIILNNASSTFTITNVTLGANFSVILTNVANAIGLLSATAVLTVPLDFDNDQLPDLWELQYGFSPTNSADATNDFDGDGMSNLQEYLAGTNPTNALSYLRINTAGALAGGGTTLTFSAVSNKTYTIQYRDEAGSGAWLRLADFTAATTNRVVAYTNAVPGSFRRFYRLTTPKLP